MKKELHYIASRIQHYFMWHFFYSPAERRHSLVGPGKLWKRSRAFQIHFLKHAGLQPHHYLLDLGCGTLRGGIPIIEYLEKGHYFGIEVRSAIIEEARRELQDYNLQGKEPQLIFTEDLSTLNLGQKFDCLWACQVFIHMTDTILHNALGFVYRHLSRDGYCYADVDIDKRHDMVWREGFPRVFRPMEFYKATCLSCGLQCEDIGPIGNYGLFPRKKKIRKRTRHMIKIQAV